MTVNRFVRYACPVGSIQEATAACSEVATLLRKERERRGISMTALAERAGLSQQMISYVEREMRIPRVDSLIRICDALGIPADRLIHQALKAAKARTKQAGPQQLRHFASRLASHPRCLHLHAHAAV